MKIKTFFVISVVGIFLLCCKQPNRNVNNKCAKSKQIEIISAQIDTLEFIAFWQDFKTYLLEQKITSLSNRINDTIIISHPKIGYGNFTKSYLIEKINVLYSIPYLPILQKYNMNENLHFTDDLRIYSVSTYFNVNEHSEQVYVENTVMVIFGYEDKDTSVTEKTIFGFAKLNGHIRLCYILYDTTRVSV